MWAWDVGRGMSFCVGFSFVVLRLMWAWDVGCRFAWDDVVLRFDCCLRITTLSVIYTS